MKSCLFKIVVLCALVVGCSNIPRVSEPFKYKMLVVSGIDAPGRVFVNLQKRVLDCVVTANEPIKVRTNHAAVSGTLQRDADGHLSFKGYVHVYSSFAYFDCPVKIGKSYSEIETTIGTTSNRGIAELFFIKFEDL